MPKVYVSSVIPAPAAEVWRLVRNFNGLPNWTPFVSESRIEQNAPPDQIGCIRNFTLKGGGRVRERLLALSDYDLSISYAILESPMEVRDYVASVSLSPVTEGNATFAEWSAEFDCAPSREAELTRQIGDHVFRAGLEGLRLRFAR